MVNFYQIALKFIRPTKKGNEGVRYQQYKGTRLAFDVVGRPIVISN